MFLGSTIGNLDPPARARFLAGVRGLLRDRDDRFLLGVDLVKDVEILEAAYDDAAGVTREFNRNILRVVNRGVGADFGPSPSGTSRSTTKPRPESRCTSCRIRRRR